MSSPFRDSDMERLLSGGGFGDMAGAFDGPVDPRLLAEEALLNPQPQDIEQGNQQHQAAFGINPFANSAVGNAIYDDNIFALGDFQAANDAIKQDQEEIQQPGIFNNDVHGLPDIGDPNSPYPDLGNIQFDDLIDMNQGYPELVEEDNKANFQLDNNITGAETPVMGATPESPAQEPVAASPDISAMRQSHVQGLFRDLSGRAQHTRSASEFLAPAHVVNMAMHNVAGNGFMNQGQAPAVQFGQNMAPAAQFGQNMAPAAQFGQNTASAAQFGQNALPLPQVGLFGQNMHYSIASGQVRAYHQPSPSANGSIEARSMQLAHRPGFVLGNRALAVGNNSAPTPPEIFGANPLPVFFPESRNQAQSAAIAGPPPAAPAAQAANGVANLADILQGAGEIGRIHIRMATHYGQLPPAALWALLPLFPDDEGNLAPQPKETLKQERANWLRRFGPGQDPAQQRAILYIGRSFGFTYPRIRTLANFSQSDSTLRGNWRAMTQRAEDRVRSPQWTAIDDELLRHFWRLRGAARNPRHVGATISWGRIGPWMQLRGGTYRFSGMACKRRATFLFQNGDLF